MIGNTSLCHGFRDVQVGISGEILRKNCLQCSGLLGVRFADPATHLIAEGNLPLPRHLSHRPCHLPGQLQHIEQLEFHRFSQYNDVFSHQIFKKSGVNFLMSHS